MRSIIKKLFGDNPNSIMYPKDRRMKIISDLGIEGMSSENFRLLLNETVSMFDMYVEVGTFKGSTLISAKYNNKALCVGVDNFSLFDDRNPENELYDNLNKISPTAEFLKGEYKTVLPEFFRNNNDLKVDVYLYDGGHTYQEQLDGLTFILPYLSENGVIFVDDSAWPEPHKANLDWLSKHTGFETILLSHFTPEEWENGTPEQRSSWGNSGVGGEFYGSAPLWWNGVRIFWRS